MKQLTLIVGDEFLASVEVTRVRAAWEKKGFGVEEADPEDAQAVFYALDTPAMFGDGRLVIVRGKAAALEREADRLVAWAERPPEGIAAVLVCGASAKLKKALGRLADVVEVAAPKPWETPEWVVRYLKAGGRVIKRDAAAALVEAVGTDLRDLAGRAEQLATSTNGAIGVADVTRLFRGHDTQLYSFLESVLARDTGPALRRLNALLASGATHPLVLTTTLANQFRALAAVRETPGAPPAALAKELGLSVGYLNRARKHARAFDAEDVRRGFELLARADDTLKGGARGNELPDRLVVELLVLELGGGREASATRR
ncbi:MAG TPA: DNA polymerase III subunit delta [Actinomycetota bacterium]